MTSLLRACKAGDLDRVKYLVSLGGAWGQGTNNFVLQFALKNEHLEVVKYLVSQGADVNATGDYVLQFASENGQLEVIKYLISQGANIQTCDNGAIRWSSRNGQLEVIKYLVSQGADIRADDDYAIRWSSRNGQLEVVKYLVSQGASTANISEKHVVIWNFVRKWKRKSVLELRGKSTSGGYRFAMIWNITAVVE